jgi:hypothetical protein
VPSASVADRFDCQYLLTLIEELFKIVEAILPKTDAHVERMINWCSFTFHPASWSSVPIFNGIFMVPCRRDWTGKSETAKHGRRKTTEILADHFR